MFKKLSNLWRKLTTTTANENLPFYSEERTDGFTHQGVVKMMLKGSPHSIYYHLLEKESLIGKPQRKWELSATEGYDLHANEYNFYDIMITLYGITISDWLLNKIDIEDVGNITVDDAVLEQRGYKALGTLSYKSKTDTAGKFITVAYSFYENEDAQKRKIQVDVTEGCNYQQHPIHTQLVQPWLDYTTDTSQIIHLMNQHFDGQKGKPEYETEGNVIKTDFKKPRPQ